MRPRDRQAILFPVVLLALPASALTQTAEVRARENLRASPGGELVAVLEPGTPLRVMGSRDRWLEVGVEAWVWTRSLQVVDRDGYDLVVSADEGENIRTRPSGQILGHLERGAMLEELERVPGWIRARRRAWIWGPSVEVAESGAAAQALAPGPVGQRSSASAARTGAAGAAILAAPNGDTLAQTRAGAQLLVVAREGSWARVRVEGWTWLPAGDLAADDTLRLVSPAELAGDPAAYRGRLVSWELQFLSVERAERIRTGFFEGEPFLLMRHAVGSYVYVALPPERLAQVLTLTPLERITVLGRVRVAASALTGSPILDLLEFTRTRR